ncbi:related to transcription factor medusa [Rhynchosporium secalis]|uniref:Related to transcription factor medusa n=1 Tax=Rhynchosporium secalis TaxID=38038 RepID=A0A1E1LZV3_RHYSE|nr:related to transcription factor medusa [Rhynchosporium secalis]
MSAYGKSLPPQLHGYDGGRTYPENAFPYAAPSYASQPPGPATTTAPVYQTAPQLTPMTYTPNQVRAPYDEQSGPYLNVGTTIPEITSFAPNRGICGTKITVYITSLYELLTDSAPVFSLMFGSRKCSASLQKVGQQGAVCSYTVVAEAPSFNVTGWHSPMVPLCMLMESGDGDAIEKVDAGQFTFIDGQNENSTSQETARKRKMSADSADMRSPMKRSSSQHLRSKDEYSTYGYAQSEGASTFSPYLQPSNNYNNLVPQYNRSVSGYQGQQARNFGYYATSTVSPPAIKAHSPQSANWSYQSASLARSSGIQTSLGLQRPGLVSLPASSANPPLIRTSTLQQNSPSPATTPHGGHPAHFNAYALYSNKAKLEVAGDLEEMPVHWSNEEFDSRRRLVHFRRSQSGSTITASFNAVSQEERPQNSVCISCIYWEEKQECFVTSVDTIYLLEHLVAGRFTVEEKNRIRRNLEGFHPVTVSKGKSDSEEFFKIIMAFPAPKPRNIEKDVKVFKWKDLTAALKKIISKYSASPSSTLPPAPTLLTPVSSSGDYVTEGSNAGISSYRNDHHGGVSPRSISGSTTSTYTNNMPARGLSTHDQKSMALQGGPPDHRMPQHPHEGSSYWQGGQHHMQGSHQYQSLGNHSNRGTWDMHGQTGPATAGGTSAPLQSLNLNYSNHRNNPADSAAATGGDNRIVRTISAQQQQQRT